MKYRIKIMITLGIVVFIGIMVYLPDKYPILCKTTYTTGSDKHCFEAYGEPYREPVFFVTLSLLLVLLILLFCKEAVIKSWLKFALFSFPVYALLVYLFTSTGSGPDGFMSPGLPAVAGEALIIALSLLYLIISLLFIFITSLRHRSIKNNVE